MMMRGGGCGNGEEEDAINEVMNSVGEEEEDGVVIRMLQ